MSKSPTTRARQGLRRRLRREGVPEAEIERRIVAEGLTGNHDHNEPSGSPRARAENHRVARTRLRRRLEAQGLPQAEIDRRVDLLAQRQDAARRAEVATDRFDAHVDAWHAAHRPDDRGYRPTTPDPLARGAARATPATVRAARRATATTKYEHDRQEPRRA